MPIKQVVTSVFGLQFCKKGIHTHVHAHTLTHTKTATKPFQNIPNNMFHITSAHTNIQQSWEYEAISGTLHIRVTGGGLHCLSGAACRGFSPAAGEPIRVVSGGDETLSPVPPSPAILFKLKQSPANKCHILSSKNGPEVEFRKSTRWGIGPRRRLFYSRPTLCYLYDGGTGATSGSFSISLSFMSRRTNQRRRRCPVTRRGLLQGRPRLPHCTCFYSDAFRLPFVSICISFSPFISFKWYLSLRLIEPEIKEDGSQERPRCLLFTLAPKTATVNPPSCC